MQTKISNQTLPQVFEAKVLFAAAIKAALPIALWRLPEVNEYHLIIDTSGKSQQVKVDFDELGKGFVVSPFQNNGQESQFLRADLHFKSHTKTLSQSLKNQELGSENLQNTQKLLAIYQDLTENPTQRTPYFVKEASHTHKEEEAYKIMIADAIKAIEAQSFKKVVLSRSASVALPLDFEVVEVFEKLCTYYPHAFVSLVSTPQVGTWMCASPETLISVNRDKIFKTIALAGTQSGEDLEDLREAMWRQKEIEEQALVSRYIINCFKKIRLREFEERGPRTTRAGNLIHLRADFLVDMKAVNFLELPTVMLELLHPTSAVCGMPKEAATDFILEHEGYDRQLYSGYLGTVNMEDESHIFVQLRCMQLLDNEAIIYAGGGITQDSNPQKEWQETQMKLKVMLKVLTSQEKGNNS